MSQNVRSGDERGSALVWAGSVAALMAALAVLLVGVGALTSKGHALQGAADLAALAGAAAQLQGQDACASARRSAALNAAEVTTCTVTGDEVEVVVTVDTEGEVGIGPWRAQLAGHANAGMLTGAPDEGP